MHTLAGDVLFLLLVESGTPPEPIVLLYLLELGQLKLLVALLHEVLLQVLVAHFLNVRHLHLIYRLDVNRFVDSVVQLEVE